MYRTRYFAAVLATFILVFEGIRFALFLKYLPLAHGIPASVILQAFLVGLRYDLLVTAFIVAPVAVVGMLPRIGWSSSVITRWITRIWMIALGGFSFLNGIADLEFFGQFNSRLNHIVFGWSETPGMSFKMIAEAVPIVQYLIIWAFITFVFGWILIRLERLLKKEEHESPVQSGLIWIISMALLVLMMRGSFTSRTTLNWSVANFSHYSFPNALALNSTYTFVVDAFVDQDDQREAIVLSDRMSPEDAMVHARRMLNIDDSTLVKGSPIARRENSGSFKNYNVVLVLVESLAGEFVGALDGVEDLSPEFDRIAQGSFLFDRFYSAGSHTFTGIFSTVTGYPAPLGQSLMKLPEGQQNFGGLATILGRRGYTCWFYVPHDPHFDNMLDFLQLNGYSRVVGQFDFPQTEVLSTLGVPDGVMFERAIQDMANLPRPFFVTLLTSTNHPPFRIPTDVPSPRVAKGSAHEKRFNAFLYSDWALGRFIDQIGSSSWSDSTIVVILGDHGTNWNPKLNVDLSLHHVPLLLYGPGIVDPGVSERLGGQVDVTSTVMDLLGGEWVNASMGQSLLRPKKGYALVVKDMEMGLIEKGRFLIHSRDGSAQLYTYPGLEWVNDEAEVRDKMSGDASALLTSLQYLVHNHLVGVQTVQADSTR